MLAKLSVKKPYFVFVAVIIVLILGGVSVTTMKTDLLPNFEVPYLAVITTDVGASPEQVEEEVTEVVEDSLASLSGVENIYSTSSENVSLVFLEFTSDTDMDSALVKVSAAVNQVSSQLPDSAGTPSYMEISMDMVASMYLGVSADGTDIAELTQLVDDTVVPALERQEGVASVSSSGDVTDSIEIMLNPDKIDNVNDGILGEVNDQLADAKSQMDAAERELERAESKLDEQQELLDQSKEDAAEQLAEASAATDQGMAMKSVYDASASALEAQIAVLTYTAQSGDSVEAASAQAQIDSLNEQLVQLRATSDAYSAQLGNSYAEANAAQTTTILTLAEAQNQLDDGYAQIEEARSQLDESRTEYEEQRDEARSSASIDALVDASTLAALIEAQNFEMPAGYVDDADSDDQWVVKVGESYSSAEELEDMVLTEIDGIGQITLGDVADVVSTDNEGESYTKMNGEDAILLSVTKQSTANTGEVCDAVNAKVEELLEDNEGLHITALMDQGSYINMFISTILTSLIAGALLAVVVLAVFLKRIRPTLVVAFSIPFSVLFALVLMYFCNISLNIMTLGALSLSIGMLVDNSIVVMENIYRLKARGLSATRAAAQGAVQVTGAIVASTLTTICVFLPFVFSDGTVRQLMVPFALTMSFALLASLLVALSVVPALASRIFRDVEPAEVKWFEKIKDVYGRALGHVLDHKAPVLIVAVALMGVAIYLVVNMGIVMLPTMTSNQVTANITMDEDMEQEDAYELVDIVCERIANVDGIDEVGVMDTSTGSGAMSGLSGLSSSGSAYTGMFVLYATMEADVDTESEALDLENRVVEACADLDDLTLTTSNSMDSMTSMLSGDVEVDITGDDMETVLELSDDVVEVMEGIEGYEEVSNGQEEADATLHIYIDKDEAASMGTTVAQIYQLIATELSDTTTAMTLSDSGQQIEVNVNSENIHDYTADSILDMEFDDGNGDTHELSEVAEVKEEEGVASISSENQVYTASVTASVDDDHNVTLLGRQLTPALEEIDVPDGCSVELAGSNETINDMLRQMTMLMVLGFILLYLIMVAQFQSLLSPFIIIFTVPLAFTGGLFALVIAGEQLSMMALLGFVILMGTVVNNGIVFVDFVNQLRLGGMAKRAALIATGKSRMRPIVMTALTTIISMCALIFSQQIGSGMERGMAIVVAGGLLYATFMTLFVVPCIYDIFNRKPMRPVDVGSDADEVADDASEFIAQMGEDAREAYDYESRRQRRKRLKAERVAQTGDGAHSELNHIDETVALLGDDEVDDAAGQGDGDEKG